jgi:hypothetical protein
MCKSVSWAGCVLNSDRYLLAMQMLKKGSSICLDACTGTPRADLQHGVDDR